MPPARGFADLVPADRLRRGARSLLARALPVAQLGARRLTHAKSPFQVTFSLTNRCNFRCTYCDIPSQARAEMSTDEWLGAIDEFADAGMGRASLIGGEPLLRKDAPRLIERLKRRGVHASMNTNGWLVPQQLDAVAQLDLVCVTLDGERAVHDAQRHPGSYDRVLDALEALRGRGTRAVTMTVLTRASVDTVDHVLAVARRFGVTAFFQLEHDASMDVRAPIAPDLTPARVAALCERLAARKREGWPVGNSFAALAAQGERRYLLDCARCWAGTYYAYVFSDGTVAPCIFTAGGVRAGNGRARGFVRAFHELAQPAGNGCSCVPSYEVNRMLDLDPAVLWNVAGQALGA
ncbi:MAG: radical SAM protein [Deltaproteobacteria bacterium]|nr:radical SAM protein [Deltaproteobacteria bacterium]